MCKSQVPSTEPLPVFLVSLPAAVESLDWVNECRAKRSLKPFLRDPQLTEAAVAAVIYRAAHLIEGHTPNDFKFLPEGAHADSAGCGALTLDWGWGTCCTYENYRYAGAAYAMGIDGRRYMHIFVRA